MAGSIDVAGSLADGASERQKRVLGVDTVRAFAALSVMLAHILGPKLPEMLQGLGLSRDLADLSKYAFTGHPAVIVFFVVSGFCIHWPYSRRALPVVAFSAARWTRIMIPAMVAIVFARLVHVEYFNFVDGYILWSIVCELWYYSLYPGLLLLSRRVPFEMQLAVAFLVSFALVAWFGSDQYGRAHVYGPGLNWLIALPSWLLGVVLANRLSGEESRKPSSGRSIILWRVAVAVVASTLYWLTMNSRIGFNVTMNPFAILVYFWLKAEVGRQMVSNRLFEWMGTWSYSIYLFHMVILAFVGAFIRSPFISIVVILLMSYLAYRLVERPSQRLARFLFRRIGNRYLCLAALR